MKIGSVSKDLMNDNDLAPGEKYEFLKKGKVFIRTSCDQLKRRIFETVNDSTVDRSMFYPKNVLSEEYHQTHPTLDHILEDFSSFITVEDRKLINREWNSIVRFQISEELAEEEDVENFWINIMECKDRDGNLLFLNLTEFVCLTLLLPNSNASAERL